MASPGSSGRRRPTNRTYSAEDQALNQIAREAESRLAARRAARAEARDIRMKELEKQQREEDDKKEKAFDSSSSSSSEPARTNHVNHAAEHRPSIAEQRATARLFSKAGSPSDDVTDGPSARSNDARELKKEVTDLEDKYKKAMMTTAQLDNEKQTYRFEVDLLKDQLEDMEEQLTELTRLHRDTTKELEAQKRKCKDSQTECSFLKEQVVQRDKLIEEYGLVFISNDTVSEEDGKHGSQGGTTALVTPEAAEVLKRGEGNLDERLRIMAEDKEKLQEEVKILKQQLEEEKQRNELAEKYASPKPANQNGPDMEAVEAGVEAQRQVAEYKFKLKKSENDITTLEGNVMRLESQSKRYKQSADNSEKNEEELKSEKRKLQRELREAQNSLEEMQTANAHLTKRLEKMKSARNAILKP